MYMHGLESRFNLPHIIMVVIALLISYHFTFIFILHYTICDGSQIV